MYSSIQVILNEAKVTLDEIRLERAALRSRVQGKERCMFAAKARGERDRAALHEKGLIEARAELAAHMERYPQTVGRPIGARNRAAKKTDVMKALSVLLKETKRLRDTGINSSQLNEAISGAEALLMR